MPAMHVSRMVEINADIQTVFEKIRDYRTWPTWSPWLLSDPLAKIEYSENTTDVGGGYSWDGTIVGAGSMEHIDISAPGEEGPQGRIQAKLVFTRPWKSEADVRFAVAPASAGNATVVHWELDSKLPFFLFWMKGMMESMLSMDYDRGLLMLKEWIETGSVASKTEYKGLVQVPQRRIVGLKGHSQLSEIGPAMTQCIERTLETFEQQGILNDGHWVSIYDKMDMKNQSVAFTTGMVFDADKPTPAGLVSTTLPACDALNVTHTGSYEHLGNAWSTAYKTKEANRTKAKKGIPSFELYLNSPRETPVEELVTEVYLPVKSPQK